MLTGCSESPLALKEKCAGYLTTAQTLLDKELEFNKQIYGDNGSDLANIEKVTFSKKLNTCIAEERFLTNFKDTGNIASIHFLDILSDKSIYSVSLWPDSTTSLSSCTDTSCDVKDQTSYNNLVKSKETELQFIQ